MQTAVRNFAFGSERRLLPHIIVGLRKSIRRVKPGFRWKVSQVIEPPLDAEVLEKPCTLLLMEDQSLLQKCQTKDEPSWQPAFQATFPTKYGLSYATFHIDDNNHSHNDDQPSTYLTFDEILIEMKQDLQQFHDAVLVARGPIASWLSLYYLESFPLLGLIMIDPLPFHTITPEQAFQEMTLPTSVAHVSDNEDHFADFLSGIQKKQLLLEPSPVPMHILQSKLNTNTTNNEYSMSHSQLVAERLSVSDGPNENTIDIVNIDEMNEHEVIENIDEWIESIL